MAFDVLFFQPTLFGSLALVTLEEKVSVLAYQLSEKQLPSFLRDLAVTGMPGS